MASRRRVSLISCTLALGCLTGAQPAVAEVTPAQATPAETAAPDRAASERVAQVEFFEKHIRPLLVDNCYTCHSADTNSKGGLRVDDHNGLIHGGEHGAAIVPGKPDESLLLKAVSYTDDELKMPPKKQLTAEQVALLRTWIEQGAAWPEADVPGELGQPNPEYDALRAKHWSWQPLGKFAPPVVSDPSWVYGNVDAFVLAALDTQKIRPVGDADKITLIRRLSYDLTGLPPAPADVDAFLADGSDDALEKVVDRLLASPAFGEHWGRHWLDVARYGESTGSSRNLPYPHAWRYRDYVIDAFNADLPYDQFIREQIAGDLLPADSPADRDRQRVATGFLALGVKDVNQRFKVRFVMDNIDEQIDTVSRAVLGLTASCARCHDHKFDPIPSTDYYALAGIFHSTDLCAGVRNKMGGGGLDYYDSNMLVRLGSDEQSLKPDPKTAKKIEALTGKIAEAKAEFDAFKGKPEGNEPTADGQPKRAVARQKWKKLQAEKTALSESTWANAQAALGVREGKAIGDTQIRVRGEAEQLGPTVPRGFLSVVRFDGAPQIDPARSGRLELAHWLTSAGNPLSRRVIVNRVWHHLFGRGLVSSVDNFGVKGDVPSHPELLDYLAVRFANDGWSIKRLVRTLVLSHAYRLSSEANADNHQVDPLNRFVWRHSPRRLTAEELRDTALVAGGNLDGARAEGSAAQELRVVELRNNGPEARQLNAVADASRRRSVYLTLLRGITPRPLEVFDFAEQGMVTGSRDATTVATQALYLLNDPFIRKQSLVLAERLLAADNRDDAERLQLAYRLALGRPATGAEIERGLRYVTEYAALLEPTTAVAQATAPAVTQVADASASAEGSANSAATAEQPVKKKPPANPDEMEQTDEPQAERAIVASSPRAAAWASFCQALVGSAEFRFLR